MTAAQLFPRLGTSVEDRVLKNASLIEKSIAADATLRANRERDLLRATHTRAVMS